jgi:hypothetical protein
MRLFFVIITFVGAFAQAIEPTIVCCDGFLLPDQAFVLKDGPASYKFYYGGDDFASINLATSTNGLNWTIYPDNPIVTDGQYHSDVHYYVDAFTGANLGTNPSASQMHYRMWYAGLALHGIGSYRYAESVDGIVWVNRMAINQTAPPVWGPGTGVSYGIADSAAIYYTHYSANNGTDWAFTMYVNVQWELGLYGGKELVLVAFSSNGYVWHGYDPGSVGYATPVFTGTLTNGDFDRDHIGWFKVLRTADNYWEAYYSGGVGSTYVAPNGIGRAVSHDGLTWTRTGSIITTYDDVPGWCNNSIWMPSVIRQNDTLYWIYFLGSNIATTDNSWLWWNLGMLPYTPPQPSWSLSYMSGSESRIPLSLSLGLALGLPLSFIVMVAGIGWLLAYIEQQHINHIRTPKYDE